MNFKNISYPAHFKHVEHTEKYGVYYLMLHPDNLTVVTLYDNTDKSAKIETFSSDKTPNWQSFVETTLKDKEPTNQTVYQAVIQKFILFSQQLAQQSLCQ